MRLLAEVPRVFSSSPGVLRSFCPTCGIRLTYDREDRADIDLTLAGLDDPEAAARPVAEWWLGHRLSWNPSNPDLEACTESGGAP